MARAQQEGTREAAERSPQPPAAGGLAPAQDPVAYVLRLQGTAGNAAVCRALARTPVIEDISVPSAMTGDRRLRHMRHRGTAFVRDTGEDATGVDVSDIRQGDVGDCFFLSPLMATVRINPRLVRRLIKGPIGKTRIGADVYEIKMRTGPDEDDNVTYRVDDRFVTSDDGNTVYAKYGDMSKLGPELWVMLLEKAWAAHRGGSYQQTHFGNAQHGFLAVTGQSSTWHYLSQRTDQQALEEMYKAWVANRPMTCSSQPTYSADDRKRARELGFDTVATHAYNLKWINYTKKTLDIDNPHGHNHVRDLPLAEFRRFFWRYCILDKPVPKE